MAYSPAYTTIAAVGNRLRGRLQVSGGGLFEPSVVDNGLIEQVLQQVEARMNAKLGTRYRLPLLKTHPVLASIAEKLCICDLMATHFVGDGQNEPGGYGRLMCSQGAAEFQEVLAGGLVGEGAIGSSVSPIANYSRHRLRIPGEAEAIDWGGDRKRLTPVVSAYVPPPIAPVLEDIMETDSTVFAGQALYLAANGHANLAKADAIGTSRVFGLAATAASAATAVNYLLDGVLDQADWSMATGFPALNPGAIYFLSPDVPGRLTSTAPEAIGQLVVSVGMAISTTILSIEIQLPILL